MNHKIKKFTTHPKCHEYIPLMQQLSILNILSINEGLKCSVDKEMRFTRIEYDEMVSTIDTKKFNKIKSEGSHHIFRCNNDNTSCVLYHLESSPINTNLSYCIDKYADKFR